ncbi:hypothetical protein [Pseudomonas sp. NPDC099000]|uniref:hypothetical protein n=1 Tax=Pseudomonas sp. NPDC099000 TaxID=3364488 RepID=UPI00383B93DE
MDINFSPKDAEAWDKYLSAAIGVTAPLSGSSDEAVSTAAALADKMLAARQARTEAYNEYLLS